MIDRIKRFFSAAAAKLAAPVRRMLRSRSGVSGARAAAADLERLTGLFLEQVGTKETGENDVIYNTHYYGRPVRGPDYPWCCAFVWDVFRMAGLSALFCGGEKTAWCPYVVNYAKNHGQWVTGDYRQGDLILYEFSGDALADHIGFCVEAGGPMLSVVEGNVDGAVRRMSRSVSSVMGAYRPSYGGAAGVRTYTVKPGDSLWEIARTQLGDGSRWREIYDLNGLTSAVIHPGQVLRLPAAQAPEAPPAVSEAAVMLRVLRPGMQGRDVATLQTLLMRSGYPLPLYGDDGEFGPETETALGAFQQDAGLGVTRTADGPTWKALIG